VHGVIFQSFRDYLVAEHGRDVVQTVFAGEPEHLLSEAYPDAALIRLIGAAAAAAERDVDEVVYGLGVFTAETTFSRLYPAFFDQTPTPRAFLLTVEEHIHELIRATIPRAGPPRLAIAALGENGVRIQYSSPRRLCVLLRGLTEGTARHYGQRAPARRARVHAPGRRGLQLRRDLQRGRDALSRRSSPTRRVIPSAS
jgi:hypothetical protein